MAGSAPGLRGAVPLRAEIARSWVRARNVGLVPEAAMDPPAGAEIDPGSRLMAAARPVLEMLETKLAGTEYCTFLADRDCRIVYRWFDDARAEQIFDGLGARPGALFLEECVGTNGLGTALELRRGIAINGAEHFADQLKRFSCYGQPIRHPLTQRVEGVLDFSALSDIANPLLSALIAHAVDDIEQRLLDKTRVSERHLLAAFQTTTTRRRHPVVALGENVVLSNRAALDLLNPADFAMLRALTGHGRPSGEFVADVPLENGVRAHVRAVPVPGTGGGAIFEITPDAGWASVQPGLIGEPGRSDRHDPFDEPTRLIQPSRPIQPVRQGPGRAPVAARLPVLISGAPGTGRTTTALESAIRLPVMVLEPALAVLEGEHAWAQQFTDAMGTGTGTVIVEGADLLNESLVHLVIRQAREQQRPDLIVTSGPVDELTGLARTLASMCVRSLDLPPLSRRGPMIGELATRVLAAVSGGSRLRLTPGAIDALVAQPWDGNLHELRAVMTHVAARRSAGDVTAADLPPAYQCTPPGRKLRGLERAERDAILAALRDSGGNKLKAAAALGVSRTTLYSRIRTLRISA